MKNIFFDTEFTGLVKDTTLISIGLISDCGKTFYAEFNDYNPELLNPWIIANVIPHLKFTPPPGHEAEYCVFSRFDNTTVGKDLYEGYSVELRGDKETIAKELTKWLGQFKSEQPIQMWGDVLAYDWVLFCDLFGGAFNLPDGVSYIPLDIATMLYLANMDPDLNRTTFIMTKEFAAEMPKHNALFDAKIIKVLHQRIMSSKFLK